MKLLRSVWGPDYGGEMEYLRAYIRVLRKKIEDDPSSPTYLLTDVYVGYRFADAQMLQGEMGDAPLVATDLPSGTPGKSSTD